MQKVTSRRHDSYDTKEGKDYDAGVLEEELSRAEEEFAVQGEYMRSMKTTIQRPMERMTMMAPTDSSADVEPIKQGKIMKEAKLHAEMEPAMDMGLVKEAGPLT